MGQYVQGVVFDSERMKREITSGAAATKLAEPTDDYARYLLDGDGGAREPLGQLLAGGELTKQGDIFGLATMALCIEFQWSDGPETAKDLSERMIEEAGEDVSP